jgi:regulator of replication initiation timing
MSETSTDNIATWVQLVADRDMELHKAMREADALRAENERLRAALVNLRELAQKRIGVSVSLPWHDEVDAHEVFAITTAALEGK